MANSFQSGLRKLKEEVASKEIDASYRSAQKYAGFLCSLFKPDSVVDLGCGRGPWLKAFKDKGVQKVVGYDGPWNCQDNMVDKSIIFYAADLNRTIESVRNERYDLALSLEVAEHLEESSARSFVESLTKLSDVIIFSAAYIGQGGMKHINEQPHTYWAYIFQEYNYIPYDLFRPVFWGDAEIDYWFQQNTFLYLKKDSSLVQTLADFGHKPLNNLLFMNCVHPDLYLEKISQSIIRKMAISAIPEPLLPLVREVKKRLFAGFKTNINLSPEKPTR